MKKAQFIITNLICEKCGFTQSISRKRSKQRPRGHIKDIWCYKCKERTKHVEGGY
jgi:hypothetical protein